LPFKNGNGSLNLNFMEKKEHLTESGLNKILAIKFSFKYGANSKLQTLFPNITPITPITPPAYNPPLQLINQNWLSGFMIAEFNFSLGIWKNCHKRDRKKLSNFKWLIFLFNKF
jgi:hypothetical protein